MSELDIIERVKVIKQRLDQVQGLIEREIADVTLGKPQERAKWTGKTQLEHLISLNEENIAELQELNLQLKRLRLKLRN